MVLVGIVSPVVVPACIIRIVEVFHPSSDSITEGVLTGC